MTKNKNKTVKLKKTKVNSAKGGASSATNVRSTEDIAPHYDTQERNQEPNTDVEIAKGSMGDSSQTDSRPK